MGLTSKRYEFHKYSFTLTGMAMISNAINVSIESIASSVGSEFIESIESNVY